MKVSISQRDCKPSMSFAQGEDREIKTDCHETSATSLAAAALAHACAGFLAQAAKKIKAKAREAVAPSFVCRRQR